MDISGIECLSSMFKVLDLISSKIKKKKVVWEKEGGEGGRE